MGHLVGRTLHDGRSGRPHNFFGYHTDSQVLREKAPKFIPEFVGPVRAISMVPDCNMRAHNDHAIYKCRSKQRQAEKLEYEEHWQRDSQ